MKKKQTSQRPPEGSIPASCCPTRGAGGEQDAVKISDTASPLPDQGWGAKWNVAVEQAPYAKIIIVALRNEAVKVCFRGELGFHEINGPCYGDESVTHWMPLPEAPRTQSVADGGEWCCCGEPSSYEHGEAGEFCKKCALPMAPPSRKERSVSGNDDKTQAPT